MNEWNPLQVVTSVGLTFSSADAPVFVASTSDDLTSSVSVGMRLRVSQSTGGIKYFIVVAIGASTVTLYGGTDYVLENEAISDPVFSAAKAPLGFPLNPLKWSVIVSDASDYTTSNPTTTWYNANSIVVPIGAWTLSWKACLYGAKSPTTSVRVKATLSTANNSESDADFTAEEYVETANMLWDLRQSKYVEKDLLLASKTTYYLNYYGAGSTGAGVLGTFGKILVRAVCAYL
jgi:hypothetical protein